MVLEVSASMICADPLRVGEELALLRRHRVAWLHVDVMDGHYSPNLTFGPHFCRACASAGIPLDIHLMVENPLPLVEPFVRAGTADGLPPPRITFHPETARQPVAVIQRIRALNGSPGIAVDPSLTVECLRHLLPLVDQVCVVCANPGHAGQSPLPFAVEKIGDLRAVASRIRAQLVVEADADPSWDDIPHLAELGADIVVAGARSLFDPSLGREDALQRMDQLLERLEAPPGR